MIKKNFENLKTIQKVQLYFIVPMLFWLFLFLFENYLIENFQDNCLYKNNTIIDIPKKKLETINLTKTIQFIEQKAKYYQLQTLSFQRKQKTIMVEFNGEYRDILGFLQKMKLHYQILTFELTQNKDLTSLYLTLNNRYFFNKNLLAKEFGKANVKNKSKQDMLKVKLEAIVDDEVLINGVWYKKGDIYKQRKIRDIKSSFIELQDKKSNKIVKVELVNEPL